MMLKMRMILTLAAGLVVGTVIAQDPNAILFRVADSEVPLYEFQYIYEKNNRDGADYSEESLNEYLDLYAKFKLKVELAKEMQLDTISSLQQELDGYRKQLAKSYLNDKEVTDKLTLEAYERMKKDVRASHILIRLNQNADAKTVDQAYEKALAVRKRLTDGEDFATVAKEVSDDNTTADRGGDLGYLTAMLPKGFYGMENAIYNQKPGDISLPTRSPIGFHLIKVDNVRPARGKVEVAHILVRIKKDRSNVQAARTKIDGIYRSLQDGQDFEELAKSVSEDERTAKRGGYIGKISINIYDPVFEEAAYNIEEEGSFSKPVQTRIGWHVIKLISKIPQTDYEHEKRQLEARMGGDERMEIARRAMIDGIRNESGFSEDTTMLNSFYTTLNEDFHSFKWEAPQFENGIVLSFKDGYSRTMEEFLHFVTSSTRFRMRASGNQTPQLTAEELYQQFADDACIIYEERNLGEKYPEFKALMREYEEGILLFEVTKMKVWDKASSDTAGLNAFFEAHRDNYMWPERARVVTYTINSDDPKEAAKGLKLSQEDTPEDWAVRMNKKAQIATFKKDLLDQEDMTEAGWEWQDGWTSAMFSDGTLSTFTRVIEILPPEHKKLNQARGYVIADYQDYLEQEWVKELAEKYPVVVNEDLLDSLVR